MSYPRVIWTLDTFSPRRRIVNTAPGVFVLEMSVGVCSMGIEGWIGELSPPSYVAASLATAIGGFVCPVTPSPDGTVLLPGSGLQLLTENGAWSFSSDTGPGGYKVLLNGLTASEGSAAQLKVANGGNLYALNSLDQWFQWTAPGWALSTAP